ncbi:M15 family metallopeptidase [Pokkaliibacter plantistimulans]|uniref:M15 family metallopeptidase n=1 Tax=Pokkaliibacter plantistimulans TaxID=1635171 RepID=UPI000D744271|nr:M15 family metallopeptidase [Pokkaliibacter plantistimulans]
MNRSGYALLLLPFALCLPPAYALEPAASYRPLSADECADMASKGVITSANPVPCQRLNKVRFRYLSDNGAVKDDGELVVLDVIAPQMAAVMDELLARQFYIARAYPVERYNGDDQASMADNNTSAFNGRPITGGTSWSLHAYGAAVDINPLQNPFVDIADDGKAQISPVASAHAYINRAEPRPGKDARAGMAEAVVDVFTRHGFFIWGGDWNYPIDYQHFQVGPRSFVEALLKEDVDHARAQWQGYISQYGQCIADAGKAVLADHGRALCVAQVIKAMP